MRHDSFRLYAGDDCQLQGYHWVPDGEPRALLEAWRQGPYGHSALLPRLPWGDFVQTLQTTFDSVTPNAYIVAPHNTTGGTNQLWRELFGGLAEIASRKALARIDADLPLLVIGGASHPLGANRRLRDLYRALCAARLNSVELSCTLRPVTSCATTAAATR